MITSDLNELFTAKLNAVKRGDIDALHEINNALFYAQLDPADPADPEYDAKLALHKLSEHEYAAERKAKQVIKKTGEPFCFEDSLSIINDVIKQAVEIFERYPCPKHAADLLGLIKCRDLLYMSNEETDTGEGFD